MDDAQNGSTEEGAGTRAPGASNRPMWCDDFDMDMLKVLPRSREIIGDLAAIELCTHGHETHGVLNHPSCWNHDRGMICFFGFDDPMKDDFYYTPDKIIKCTAIEAFRDLWAHNLYAVLCGRLLWDTQKIMREFDTIMFHIRGWQTNEALAKRSVEKCERSLMEACRNLRAIAGALGAREETSPPHDPNARHKKIPPRAP
jgi:hypothetical protein